MVGSLIGAGIFFGPMTCLVLQMRKDLKGENDPGRGPLALSVGITGPREVSVRFTNRSDGIMLLAEPERLGGLLRVVPEQVRPGEAPPASRGGSSPWGVRLFSLAPGGSCTLRMKLDGPLPAGTVRAVYDSRASGGSLPEGVWRGGAESPPVIVPANE